MPTAGRPPKPTEQKRRLGNPGKRALPVAVVPISPAIRPLEGLGELGLAFIEAGAGAWLARADQLGLLRLIEDGFDEYQTLRTRWVASDFSNDTVMKRLGVVEGNLTKWLSLAGLTPVDRSRLGVAEVKAKSKLEEIMERRARMADSSPTSSSPSSASPRGRKQAS